MASFQCTLILSEDKISKIKLICTKNTIDVAGEVMSNEPEGRDQAAPMHLGFTDRPFVPR
jgi:hypothetical protein